MKYALLLVLALPLAAQQPQNQADAKKAKKEKRAEKEYTPPPVFLTSEPLQFTVTAPYGQIRKDRRDRTPYRPSGITYRADSGDVRVPVGIRTHGHWRRSNCDMPPLLLHFSKDSTKKTEFHHLRSVRLVVHCRNNDEYEQYVLKEFQLYRVQRLVTPLSLNVRLARVTYIDSEKKDTVAKRYAFLLEEPEDFARRVGGRIMKAKGATGSDLDGQESAIFGVFQYMIANTDFSIGGLHNVILLGKDTSYYPVAYDFDWAGAVNARYAFPDSRLRIRRVTDRIMRGYCTEEANYQKAFALFRDKKDSIYALYRDSIAAALKPDEVTRALKYFDEFYEVINDPRLANRFIVRECLQTQA